MDRGPARRLAIRDPSSHRRYRQFKSYMYVKCAQLPHFRRDVYTTEANIDLTKVYATSGQRTTQYCTVVTRPYFYIPWTRLSLSSIDQQHNSKFNCCIVNAIAIIKIEGGGRRRTLSTRRATVQIGLRGSSYTVDAHAWQISKGFHIVQAHQCWHKSLEPLMKEVKAIMGDRPVYLSFDIDAIDPGFCPGTGTPEIGGLTPIQALEIIRGCRGLNLVGCDLVEVSPPYDFEGTTALTGANLLFEMLCVLPRVKYYDFK
ncbi:guanidinobutyrase-like [Penaeus monodon]|uniref:guanidinobutyrase-like n=1 Tax=Penaeus monodon TaxID=6687 RepID=UPI0018A6DAD6|nr:guanidinobutyrase-like [Penaeus monodon]